jgi:hypothetical protein
MKAQFLSPDELNVFWEGYLDVDEVVDFCAAF